MGSFRIPAAVCAVASESIVVGNSHKILEALFRAAGVPGEPPGLSHGAKWKIWLMQACNDPSVDGLAILGRVIEEFMDLPPADESRRDGWAPEESARERWVRQRNRLSAVLEEHGLRYFRGGRVMPSRQAAEEMELVAPVDLSPRRPDDAESLIRKLIHGLHHAMYPLSHRRKGLPTLSFESEYDVQDLLHALLRPWVKEIKAEEYTPSLAGSSTRVDFLLPDHGIAIETKIIRDRGHGHKVGDELLLDLEHYRQHPECRQLWCVVYDPRHLLENPAGLVRDLQGARVAPNGSIEVKVFILPRR